MRLLISRKMRPNVANRLKKKIRVRKSVSGSEERPRLSIYRSTKHFYAQVIDDVSGKTLASASTLEKGLDGKSGKEAAALIGSEVAKRALGKKIQTVVFDRNGYLYHGCVKVMADAAREAGLKF